MGYPLRAMRDFNLFYYFTRYVFPYFRFRRFYIGLQYVNSAVSCSFKGKGKGRALVIATQVDIATAEALRYMARTKQRRTYLPYTFPAVAGTHLPTPRGWRVE